MARVKARLRRYKKYGVLPDTAQAEAKETLMEFKILQTLCMKKAKAVTSEDLFKSVWPDEYYDKNNDTITVHVRHLRKKMGDAIDEPRHIKTIWGSGI